MSEAGWGTDKPKVAGWYWRRRQDGSLSIVEVIWDAWDSDGNGEFIVQAIGLNWPVDKACGEWAGPLVPPGNEA